MSRSGLPGIVVACASLVVCPGVRAAGASDAPPTLRLPATAEPVEYSVDLTIDPVRDDFHGVVEIDIRVKEPIRVLWLNATDLKVEKASAVFEKKGVAVTTLTGGSDFIGFEFEKALGPGRLKLHLDYTGLVRRDSTQGLFRQKDGDDWYVFSQFESTDARRAFPCFDEPAFKVPWQLTVRIPKGTTVVSNTPILSEGTDTVGGHSVRFARTPPLPSYLVAVAVGPFEYVDAGRAGLNKIPIRIVTPRGKGDRARYAKEISGPLVEALEKYFGIPYPYAKLDHLAIPQTVQFSAMENVGLITWAEQLLLVPPAEETVAFRRLLASIGAHETSHQWFGDLVTMGWWNDIWLNESFATWMATKTVMAVRPEWKEELERVGETSAVMGQDELVSARKVRQEIASKDDIVNAFDNMSYAKGAALLAMFEGWVGEERFQAGVRRYLGAHRNATATTGEFLQAIESASRPGVAAAFSSFLDQPGVPMVRLELECSGQGARVALSQERLRPIGSAGPDASKPWQVPVCLRTSGAGEPHRECVLLSEATSSVALQASGCPARLFANDGQTGYYRAQYPADLLGKVLSGADTELSLAERVGLIGDAGALARAGALPIEEALALVPRFAADPSRQITEAAFWIAYGIRENRVRPDRLRSYARFVQRAFGERARALGFQSRAGDDDDARLLRKLLVPFVTRYGTDEELQGEAKRLALAWLDDRKAVEPDLVMPVLTLAARHGDEALFGRFVDAVRRATEARDRQSLFLALGTFEDGARVEDAVSLFLSDTFNPMEANRILFAAAYNETTRGPLWEAFKVHYDAIASKFPGEGAPYLLYFPRGFCDVGHRKDVEEFFRERVSSLAGGPRTLAQTLEQIDLCVAVRAQQEDGIGRFLDAY